VQEGMMRTYDVSSRQVRGRDGCEAGVIERNDAMDAPYVPFGPCSGGGALCVGGRRNSEEPSIRVQGRAGTALGPFDHSPVTWVTRPIHFDLRAEGLHARKQRGFTNGRTVSRSSREERLSRRTIESLGRSAATIWFQNESARRGVVQVECPNASLARCRRKEKEQGCAEEDGERQADGRLSATSLSPSLSARRQHAVILLSVVRTSITVFHALALTVPVGSTGCAAGIVPLRRRARTPRPPTPVQH
jgi:hypothetical protein